MARTRRTPITRLADHPCRDDVLAVLARVPHLADGDLSRLASCLRTDGALAAARDRALTPDSPLVCEVLAAFDELAELFEPDLQGAPFVTLAPDVAAQGLDAVQDMLAACYARPVLSRRDYRALSAPWRAVFPRRGPTSLDLGPQSPQLSSLLAAMSRLSRRCHDGSAAERFEQLADQGLFWSGDRDDALAVAFQAAIGSDRRRLWALVRRSGAQLLDQRCRGCAPSHTVAGGPAGRVHELCLDAACGLLVADLLPPSSSGPLTDPVRVLLPSAGRAGWSS